LRKLNLVPKPSAKDYLLRILPRVLALFDVPQNILGFNAENIARRQIYAMSEETAEQKLNALKEMLEKWSVAEDAL